jgi:hypothetical protein
MRLLALALTIGGTALLAGCRMRTEEAGVTPTSSAPETGGRAGVDSSSNRDAEETMSQRELEKELDQLERELTPGRGGGGP